MSIKNLSKLFMAAFIAFVCLYATPAHAGIWDNIVDFFTNNSFGLDSYNTETEEETTNEDVNLKIVDSGCSVDHGDCETEIKTGQNVYFMMACEDGGSSSGIEYKFEALDYPELFDSELNSKQRDSGTQSTTRISIPTDYDFSSDMGLAVRATCSKGDQSLIKTFYFQIEQSEINLTISSDVETSFTYIHDATMLVDETATLTVKFSGDVKNCTDADCTGTLFRYINDVLDTSDDSGLEVTLKEVKFFSGVLSANPFTTSSTTTVSSPTYTATYEVMAVEEGSHEIVIRVNGDAYTGQYEIKGYRIKVSEEAPTVTLPDNDGDGYTILDDCNDFDATINPGATEVCDGLDNNCTSLVDDEDPSLDITTANDYYADSDSDNYGDSSNLTQTCDMPSGYVEDDTDCDDADANANPGASEICDDGVDNDCDGTIDESDCVDGSTTDSDGDGYVVTDDCDDSDANINPGETETCDGVDNNCDGDIDEGVTTTYYLDDDGDGYGDSSTSTDDCEQPTSYVEDDTDCDDTDFSVYPTADELCDDGVDNNCDGSTDETDCSEIVEDNDGDGIDNTEDCDDDDAEVYPGAEEVCDDIDNNCDGDIDEIEDCELVVDPVIEPVVDPAVDPIVDPNLDPDPTALVLNLNGGSGCSLSTMGAASSNSVFGFFLLALILGVVRMRKKSPNKI